MRELLIAPLIEVFAELTLAALELLVELGELALSARPVGFTQNRGVTIEALAHGFEARRHLLQLLVALAELLFQLLLGGFRGHSVLEDALGIHEPDARGGILRMRRHAQRQEGCGHACDDQLHGGGSRRA